MKHFYFLLLIFISLALNSVSQDYVKNYQIHNRHINISNNADIYMTKFNQNTSLIFSGHKQGNGYGPYVFQVDRINNATGMLLDTDSLSIDISDDYAFKKVNAFYGEVINNERVYTLVLSWNRIQKIVQFKNGVEINSIALASSIDYPQLLQYPVHRTKILSLNSSHYIIALYNLDKVKILKVNKFSFQVDDIVEYIIDRPNYSGYVDKGFVCEITMSKDQNGDFNILIPSEGQYRLMTFEDDFTVKRNLLVPHSDSLFAHDFIYEGNRLDVLVNNFYTDGFEIHSYAPNNSVFNQFQGSPFHISDYKAPFYIDKLSNGNYFFSIRGQRLWLSPQFNEINKEEVSEIFEAKYKFKPTEYTTLNYGTTKVWNDILEQTRMISLLKYSNYDETTVFPFTFINSNLGLKYKPSVGLNVYGYNQNEWGVSTFQGDSLLSSFINYSKPYFYAKDSVTKDKRLSSIFPNHFTWGAITSASNVPDNVNRDYDFANTWYVSKEMIDEHIVNYNNPFYVMPLSIKSWPGNRASQNGLEKLAPFIDVNNDGVYSPQNGDYPAIKGDQTVYSLINGMHLFMNRMAVEIATMTYTFDCNDEAIKNTVFSETKIENRGNEVYDSTWFIISTDGWIGNGVDQALLHFQTNVQQNMQYYFTRNSESRAGALGIKLLKGMPQIKDGIDNDFGIGENESPYGKGFGNSIIDDEEWGIMLSHSSYVNDPGDANTYYNIALEYDRKFNDSIVKFSYPDGSDPYNFNANGYDVDNWNVHSNSFYDPLLGTIILGTGPGRLRPNESVTFEHAYIVSSGTGSHPQSDTTLLFQYSGNLEQYYAAGQTPCGQTFGYYDPQFILSVPEEKVEAIKLYPNPAKDRVVVENTSAYDQFQVFDYNGRLITSGSVQSNIFEVNTSQYANGFYVIRFLGEEKVATKKFIINH